MACEAVGYRGAQQDEGPGLRCRSLVDRDKLGHPVLGHT
jgi:hypothetical protein